MAQNQVALQADQLVIRDPHACELAEPGIHPVDRIPTADRFFNHPPRTLNAVHCVFTDSDLQIRFVDHPLDITQSETRSVQNEHFLHNVSLC